VDQIHKYGVLVLDVGLFLFHFSFQNKVTEVPFLREPNEKFLEGCLYGSLALFAGNEQTGYMARSRYPFDSAQKVCFGGLVVAAVLFAKILNFASVGCTQVLSDYFFGDIPTDVLPVVARFLALGLLFLGFEDFRTGRVLFLVCWVVGEDKWALTIGGRAH